MSPEERQPYVEKVRRAKALKRLRHLQVMPGRAREPGHPEDPEGVSAGAAEGKPLPESLWGIGDRLGYVAPSTVQGELENLPQAAHSSITAVDAHLKGETSVKSLNGFIVEDDHAFDQKTISRWKSKCRSCRMRHEGLCMDLDHDVHHWVLLAAKALRRFFRDARREHVGKILIGVEGVAPAPTATGPFKEYYWLEHKIGMPAKIYLAPAAHSDEDGEDSITIIRPMQDQNILALLRDWKTQLEMLNKVQFASFQRGQSLESGFDAACRCSRGSGRPVRYVARNIPKWQARSCRGR